jgi:hypothetical protein
MASPGEEIGKYLCEDPGFIMVDGTEDAACQNYQLGCEANRAIAE